MKTTIYLSALFLLAGLLPACRKDKQENLTDDNRRLIGIWVEATRLEDTLVIYRSGNQVILFDNSTVYRSRPNPASPDNVFKWIVSLEGNTLSCRPFDFTMQSTRPGGTYFQWLAEQDRFELDPSGFRWYMSCIGCKQEFVRVK